MPADLNIWLRLKLADEATAKARAAMRRLHDEEDRAARASRRRAMILKGAAIGAAAAGAALATSIKWAIEFEESIAGVSKVLEMSDAGIEKLSDGILGLSRQSPMAAGAIAEIVEMAAQAGVVSKDLPDNLERQELLRFAEDVAKMAVAFDVTASDAAKAMIKMRNQLGMTQEEVMAFADTINFVGNNSGAGSDQILAVIERVGALGELAGVSQNTLVALASTFVETSTSVEVAGTGFKNFLDALTAGSSATEAQLGVLAQLGLDAGELAERMQEDAAPAIMDVMERLAELDAADRPAALRQLFGKESLESIGPLLNRLDIMRKNLDLVAEDAGMAGSMLEEYEKQMRTTANQWRKLKNNIHALGVMLGREFLPHINRLTQAAIDFLNRTHNIAAPLRDSIRAFMKEFEGLSLYEAGVKLMESLGRGMWSVLTRLVDEIEAKLAGIVPDWMRRGGGTVAPPAPGEGPGVGGSQVPRSMRAIGGPVRAGIAYQWQEEGRELFVPATDVRVISNREVRTLERSAAAGGARNVTFNQSFTINAPAGMSPRDIARAIDERFRRATQDSALALHDGELYA